MNWKLQKLYLSKKSFKKAISPIIFNKKLNEDIIKNDEAQLGDELVFIRPKTNCKTIQMEQNQKIQKMLQSSRNKYIVIFDTIQRIQSSYISIYENPIYYDQLSCKYYLVKYYINPKSLHNFELIQLIYLISEYIYIQKQCKFIVNFIIQALEQITPIWNKFNYLFFYQISEEVITEASTCENIQSNEQLTYLITEKSQQSNSGIKPEKIMKSLELTRNTTQCFKSLSTLSSHHKSLFLYFNKIIDSIKIMNSFNKIFQINRRYPSHGIFYTQQHVKMLIESINCKKSLKNLHNQFLKMNLINILECCKRMYMQAMETCFQEAKSMEFNLLKSKLNTIYDKLIQIYNEEFESYLMVQDVEIYMNILKRWISNKQQEIFILNDMLLENQCSEYIDHGEIFQFNLDSIKSYFEYLKIETISNISLENMIAKSYLPAIKQEIEKLKVSKKKQINKKINYAENKFQRLKNSEARMKIFSDKKTNLQNGINILILQNQNLDNLYNGLQIENQKFEERRSNNLMISQRESNRLLIQMGSK